DARTERSIGHKGVDRVRRVNGDGHRRRECEHYGGSGPHDRSRTSRPRSRRSLDECPSVRSVCISSVFWPAPAVTSYSRTRCASAGLKRSIPAPFSRNAIVGGDGINSSGTSNWIRSFVVPPLGGRIVTDRPPIQRHSSGPLCSGGNHPLTNRGCCVSGSRATSKKWRRAVFPSAPGSRLKTRPLGGGGSVSGR